MVNEGAPERVAKSITDHVVDRYYIVDAADLKAAAARRTRKLSGIVNAIAVETRSASR